MDSANGPQTQTFTYDNLDRLTSAAATGGADGLYSESYSYDPATGNLASKGSLNLTYADSAHPHAATGLSNGNTYAYNAAGSTVTRVIGADTYSLVYDSENRVKTVQKNGAVMAEFLYDGDGTRVLSTINGVTTRFVGDSYEVTGTSVTKYYGGGPMRVAGVLYYLLSDHLGSNSVILDTAGNVVGETRYTAWGEERYSSGSVSSTHTYTGQYSNTDDFGLMYYKARWYDPVLGRFAQADSIVPEGKFSGNGLNNQSINIPLIVSYTENGVLQNVNLYNHNLISNSDIEQSPIPLTPGSFDRFSYVLNNPINSTDPSGHCLWDACVIETVAIVAIVAVVGLLVTAAISPEASTVISQNVEAIGGEISSTIDSQMEQLYVESIIVTGITEGLVTLSQKDSLPREGDFPYVPQKQKGNPPYVPVRGGGFRDDSGRVWKRDKSGHAGPHWDVQLPNGGHVNVNDKGEVIHGK